MSMLSAQVDELCERADAFDGYQNGEISRLMRDAADTIWELRCKLASMVDERERARVAENENAKLREDLEFERSENGWAREFLNRMGQKCGTKDCPSLVAYVTKLEAENAELRELVVEVFDCARRGAVCETCKVNNDGYACVYIMRELGIEVER